MEKDHHKEIEMISHPVEVGKGVAEQEILARRRFYFFSNPSTPLQEVAVTRISYTRSEIRIKDSPTPPPPFRPSPADLKRKFQS